MLVFERTQGTKEGIIVICNFDETPQVMDSGWLMKLGYFTQGNPKDLVSGKKIGVKSGLLELGPYQMIWLKKT